MFNKMGSQSAAWSIHNKEDYVMAGMYTTFVRTPTLLCTSAASASSLHANLIPTEFVPDSQDGKFPESNIPDKPQEFSRLGWTDSTGWHVYFSAGDKNADPDPLAESLARALRGKDTPDLTAQELSNSLFGPETKIEWFPYPDKAGSYFSNKNQRAKDLGATVPTYNKFRQTQDMLLAEVGNLTKRQESGWGNDMSNLFMWAGMTLYPEDAGDKLGEVWQREKMLHDIPDDRLTPTIRHNGVIYCANMLVQSSDGSWLTSCGR
ncbi:hypothetical protein DFH09DRAFT_1112732 [Mycena vulgaris]|nr:hypothetical protein DFH09DRAFT_1112732 [Mycena vulgaris]